MTKRWFDRNRTWAEHSRPIQNMLQDRHREFDDIITESCDTLAISYQCCESDAFKIPALLPGH